METTTYKIENVMKSIVASLIILISFSVLTKGENLVNEANAIVGSESELQVESWMNSNNYWNGNADKDEQELVSKIESWMNNSAYWTGTANTENIEEIPALVIESWMNSDNYWNGNADIEERELALEIESWMNNSAYWTGTDKKINCGTGLANN